MGKSTYAINSFLGWIKGTAMPTAPATLYLSLFNGDPNSGGTEVTTTIRTAGRLAVAFGAISAGAISNSALVDFGNAAGGATITHFGIHDAASAGNLLGSTALTGGSQVISAGTDVSFAAGAVTWTET